MELTPEWEVTCWTDPRVPILLAREEEVAAGILAKLDQLLVVDDWLDDCTVDSVKKYIKSYFSKFYGNIGVASCILFQLHVKK